VTKDIYRGLQSIPTAVASLSPARSKTLSTARYFLKTVNSALGSVKSLTDCPSWSPVFSNFHVKPKPTFCSKVVVHYTIFIFVTAAMGKFLLD
jgi:hypothetical protein